MEVFKIVEKSKERRSMYFPLNYTTACMLTLMSFTNKYFLKVETFDFNTKELIIFFFSFSRLFKNLQTWLFRILQPWH